MSVVSMKQLLEAGAHFGHRTRRWEPKMKPYIFTERKGIHIIDLQKTLQHIEEAYNFVRDLASKGEDILFVGTKKQAQQIVVEEAKRCGGYYVNHRWLGGLLTNFNTVKLGINKLEELTEYVETEDFSDLPKKEQAGIRRKLEKLEKNLGGLRGLKKKPGVIFLIDPKKEEIAIKEANKLKIPTISMVDTNCDPDVIDFVIPSNDDAIRAIMLIASTISNAVIEGREGLIEEVETSETNDESIISDDEEKVEEESVDENFEDDIDDEFEDKDIED